ncbi:2,3-bisphosphoglycerate-independent phosphoglycerate mutase [Ketobacter sp.]|uniref:2,3-bisphosphoglycerate-independent phosphoglycerate mutase n=1 Tax=Ketobacter sp. TaxID=2083498 RepID=UPI000F1A0F78|nr:2,3-bisphosphoglycerate-independent phosphoglycerate mutase [Ketobacter sp.]RLU01891.1 MAG: 2,3-bisphosphoglycerate-independent phosphoglycerate mutase [Ketobacter sp.]
MSQTRKPHVLIILDGFGHRTETEFNAIAHANTPTWDKLWSERPHTLISGSGMDVGLPQGQMGNSEVGHMNLGAGRIVYQDFTRITKDIEDGGFFENAALVNAVNKANANHGAVHLMGLLSPGGVHSHEDHFLAMIELAKRQGAKQVYVHAFLDGRDMPPKSAQPSLERIQAKLDATGNGRIASIIGRYYAMDRDNRWERVAAAYNLLTLGEADYTSATPVDALLAAYERDETDEFVKPTVIAATGQNPATLNDGDSVIFMNFRADRARQITRAIINPDFDGFERKKVPALAEFVMLTQYAADIKAPCAYPPEELVNVLGEYLAKHQKTQLRIAETEKYAHVTFFFSGGQEDPFPGEERILVKSPNVATYDLQPEMSAPEVTDKLVEAINSGQYDVLICNYANGDMVGHTGKFEAAVKAVEALDGCLARLVSAVEANGGDMLITADHGNCEQMEDPSSGQPHTAHTTELVPLVYVGGRAVTLQAQGGRLSDIAPTLLKLMGLPQPAEMSGQPLL